MKRTSPLIVWLALGTVPAGAQTVGGSVLEAGSGAAVMGAAVSLEQVGGPAHGTASTDARGAFVIPLSARSGRYQVRVEHPSFKALVDTLELRSGEAVTLTLRLGRETIPLAPLVVTARAQRRLQGYYERLDQGGGFGRFLTRSELDRIPANRTTDFLRRVPGIRLEPFNGGNLVTISNPAGGCTPLLYIDGIPLEQLGPDEVDARLQPGTLEGIEVYTGMTGLPAEFAASQPTGCGAVAFWTQDPGGRRLTWVKVLASLAAFGAFALTSMRIML